MSNLHATPLHQIFRAVSIATLVLAVGLSAVDMVPGSLPQQGPQGRSPELAEILNRCAAYCERLSDAVLDFVCQERVDEMVADLAIELPAKSAESAGFENPGDLQGIAKSSDPGQKVSSVRVKRKNRSQFIYDYQLVQDKQGHIQETRSLIKENGRQVMEKNALLKTQVFKYSYIIMGPVTLLGRDRQQLFNYDVIKETTLGKDRAVVIKATPKPNSPRGILSGKIWVRKSDAGVLRIEWVPESVGHYDKLAALAKQMGGDLRLTLATELGVEKNGIRFPSRYTIEETYSFATGTPLVRSMTEVTLSDYKFFTVETGVVIR